MRIKKGTMGFRKPNFLVLGGSAFIAFALVALFVKHNWALFIIAAFTSLCLGILNYLWREA